MPTLILWFLVFWGAGYRRIPIEKTLGFKTSAIPGQEFARFRSLLLDQVKVNVPLQRDRGSDPAIRAIASAMARIVGGWEGRAVDLPAHVKQMPAGFLLFNGTAGMCSPFTLEALVDRGLPETALVYSAAHELAHVAGFCSEDEASFVGYLSGLNADDRFARYACALNAYMDSISSLEKGDFRTAFEALPDPAKRDLTDADASYRKYRVAWFSRMSWVAYDRYLQTQGIREGVRNYSHGITLLGYAWRNGLLGTR